jgi:hypothetical protein
VPRGKDRRVGVWGCRSIGVGRAEGGKRQAGTGISFQLKGGSVKETGVCVCGAELAGKAAFTAGRPREYCSAYCRLRAWRLEAKERRGRSAKADRQGDGGDAPCIVTG